MFTVTEIFDQFNGDGYAGGAANRADYLPGAAFPKWALELIALEGRLPDRRKTQRVDRPALDDQLDVVI